MAQQDRVTFVFRQLAIGFICDGHIRQRIAAIQWERVRKRKRVGRSFQSRPCYEEKNGASTSKAHQGLDGTSLTLHPELVEGSYLFMSQ